MKILGKILGSDKAIEYAAKGIDKAFFTKQEKSENWIGTLKAYEPFKLTQRLLSLLVGCVYLFVWLLCAIMMVSSYWLSDMMEISKTLAKHNHETLSLSFALIVGFYFAGGAAEGIIRKIKSKRRINQ